MDRIKSIIKRVSAAYLAGVSIFLGALVYLSVDDKVIGSALFSVGLFVVCTMQLDLFTGKVCYCLDDEDKLIKIARVITIWFWNFVGALSMSLLIIPTRIYQTVSEKAKALCNIKLNDSYSSLFVLGILCNIFIFIGVHEYRTNEHVLGKYLGIVLGVMCFILIGTEHCIADMCYIAISGDFPEPLMFRLLVITAGNAIGGIAVNKLMQVVRKD